MFWFGKRKYSDEQKLLFQRWHNFSVNCKYELKYIHHTGTQMLSAIQIPESRNDEELRQFEADLTQEIEGCGLYLANLNKTAYHYLLAVRVTE